MKIAISTRDIGKKKINKIAKIIEKSLKPGVNLNNRQIMGLFSQVLGYKDLHDLQKSAVDDIYPLIKSSSVMNFSRHGLTPLPLATTVDILKPKFVEIFTDVCWAPQNFWLFNQLNIHTFDFFSIPASTHRVADNPEAMNKVLNFFRYLLNSSQRCVLSGSGILASNTIWSDVFIFLETLDKKEAHKQINNTVRGFLREEFEDEDGRVFTFRSRYFLPRLRELVEDSITWALEEEFYDIRITKDELNAISSRLESFFYENYDFKPLSEIFKVLPSSDGFHFDPMDCGSPQKWDILPCTIPDSGFHVEFTHEPHFDDESETQAHFWRICLIDQNGERTHSCSGSFYISEMPKQFNLQETPWNGDITFEREEMISSAIGRAGKNKAFADTFISALESGPVITVNTWERLKTTATGSGIDFLSKSISCLESSLGESTKYIFVAPLEYREWIPENDPSAVRKMKKVGYSRLLKYVEACFKGDASTHLVSPRI